jgi:hypothetical protein
VANKGGAFSGAVLAKTVRGDPALQQLIDVWPALPKAVKAGISAMASASAEEEV